MATVKGDVHDIGKNIVGVVLQCNNYEVIDLGVMVPADRILDEAVKHKVDIVGLSGLITPSLDEMVFVAGEMQRRGFAIPLLIGGATTSRTHTAVKIEPGYTAGSTTYVVDASRAVGVVSGLLSMDNKADVEAATRAEYVKIREQFSRAQKAKIRTPLAAARSNFFRIDWNTGLPPAPSFTGTRTFSSWDLGDLRRFIDWSPFFAAWELVGRFPAILDDDVVGEVARSLYADASAMLDKIVAERWFEARGVVGLWPANSDGDDVIFWTDESRTVERARFHSLRQQMAKAENRANVALADFIAPVGQGDDHMRRALRSPPATARRPSPRASRRPATTTTPSSARLSPTAWQRLSPRPCTTRCAPSCGATRRERVSIRKGYWPKGTRASVRRRATPPSPTTPKRRRCSACSMRPQRRGSS